jgi:hypothetical protein
MPNVLCIDNTFLSELVKIPASSKILSTEFVDNILTYKWNNYGRFYFLLELSSFFIYTLLCNI